MFESIGGDVGKRAFELLEDGVVLGRVYRLDEIAEAHRALASRTTTGKLIARP